MKTLSFTESFLFRIDIETENIDSVAEELTDHGYYFRLEKLLSPNKFTIAVRVDNYAHATIFMELLESLV